MVERKRVFSGLQPTGNIHVGNYLGALRNWVRLQDEYDCVYCIVDLHAITVDYDVAAFAKERREAAKVLIACGVDPARSLFYYQSQVPQHTELAWILGTFTGMGQLSRMTQFKDKSETAGANLGLFAYPVLMAADILLYPGECGPGGRRSEAAPRTHPRPGAPIQRPIRRGVPPSRAHHPRARVPGHVAAGCDSEDVEVRSR